MIRATSPTVTISLVVWNGMRWLPSCLDSVAAQTIEDYELLIIDNASTDGSASWLRDRTRHESRVRLIESDRNLGYAVAHNRAIRGARGDAVLLLNQDVVLDPGFLAAAVEALREHPRVAAVQGRVLRLGPAALPTNVVDTTGLEMGRDRRAVSRDQLLLREGLDRPAGPVWGADGPVPVYRRAALLDVRLPRRGGSWEVLDEDYFMQKEDVDLAWRLRRFGWDAWYEPRALAWHARTGGDTGAKGLLRSIRANMSHPPRMRALAWRNQRLMQLKNDEPAAVLRDLPWIVRRELAAWMLMIAIDQRRLAAVPDLFQLAPMALRKRRAVAHALARRGRPT